MTDETVQFIQGLRAEHAIYSLTETLAASRGMVTHYEAAHEKTGWTCDREMVMFYEGRVAALVYALNLLCGYRADR